MSIDRGDNLYSTCGTKLFQSAVSFINLKSLLYLMGKKSLPELINFQMAFSSNIAQFVFSCHLPHDSFLCA